MRHRLLSLSIFDLVLLCMCTVLHLPSYAQHRHNKGVGKNGCVPRTSINLETEANARGKTYQRFIAVKIGNEQYIKFGRSYFHPSTGSQKDDSIPRLYLRCDQEMIKGWNNALMKLQDSLGDDYNDYLLEVGICSDKLLRRTWWSFSKRYFEDGAIMYNKRQYYPAGNYCENPNYHKNTHRPDQ